VQGGVGRLITGKSGPDAPEKLRVTIDIMSPESDSPLWHGLIWAIPDHTRLYILNIECFELHRIGELLVRVEEMVSARIAPAEIESLRII
jgi:hypothetical protein